MEITANAPQTVNAGSNVLFTATPIKGSCSILHQDGSGLSTLRGMTNQCRALFKASFNANIGLPATGSPGAIQIAIAINGEAIPVTTMISTPAAVSTLQNVSAETFIEVPKGTTLTVSVKNTSSVVVNVANANFIIERVA